MVSAKGEKRLVGPAEKLSASAVSTSKVRGEWLRFIKRNRALYVMLIPCIIYLLLFKYVPMLGSVIAFKNYSVYKGLFVSEWIGFKWFEQLFTYPQFTRLLKNTLILSLYKIIFAFPAPIILACLLNELRRIAFKRVLQTIVYMPHFLSWTIIYGLVYMMFSTQSGMVTQLVTMFGGSMGNVMQDPEYFRTLVVGAGIWKEMGWGTIIFLAALAGIDPTLYEAAKIDGAGRWKQFVHITFTGLIPAIMILLLLKIGNVLDLGFEQIWLFLNPITYEVGDVLDTYAYRAGIVNGQYSLTTAIGLFKSFIGLILLVVANRASKATTGEGVY